MGELVFGAILLVAAFFVRLAAAAVRGEGASRPIGGVLRLASLGMVVVGVLLIIGATTVIINAGEVGVQHAFGRVNPTPLMSGIRFVPPWSSIERYSTR